MSPFFSDLVEQAQAFSRLEIIAVLLAVAYLLLAIRQSIWCWYCAGVSTAIYIWLFIDAKLYMESVLNGFYFVMAIYGWFVWRTGGNNHDTLPVTRWPLRIHGAAIGIVMLLSAINGYLLTQYTDAAFPYLDSLTTWSAIWATFLVARKVLGLMVAYCDNDGSELRENFIGSESVPTGPKDRGWIDAGLFGKVILDE